MSETEGRGIMSKNIILIDRQSGSGGREVGKMLADKLGIPFYDGQMLLMAADKYGLNPGVMKEYDEKNVKSMIYMIAMYSDYGMEDTNKLLPQKIYNAMSQTIMKLANEGPCVIMGRCADYILSDRKDCLSIFIYASDMSFRIQRAVSVDNVPEKEAAGYIKKRDKQRREYYNFHTDGRWGETTNYDLCLNTSSLGYDTCVSLIESMCR